MFDHPPTQNKRSADGSRPAAIAVRLEGDRTACPLGAMSYDDGHIAQRPMGCNTAQHKLTPVVVPPFFISRNNNVAQHSTAQHSRSSSSSETQQHIIPQQTAQQAAGQQHRQRRLLIAAAHVMIAISKTLLIDTRYSSIIFFVRTRIIAIQRAGSLHVVK